MARYTLYALGGLAVLALLIGGTWAYRYYTAETRGIVGQEERVQSAPFRMQAYERFYDLCATVQGHEATLTAQQKALDGAENSGERSRIRANIAGIEAQRARDIARYNADARKDHTIGQFQASDLPYQLDESEDTSC